MKRLMSFLLLPLCFLLLASCGTKDSGDGDQAVNGSGGEPGIEGYVMKKEDGRMLVVSSVPKDFSSTGGMKEFYNAIWFSKAPGKVEIGDKVQVWFDIVAESYPGQSEALKVEIIPSKHPRGADLNEAEVIRLALKDERIDPLWVSAIKSIEYNAKSDVWNVVIKQNEEEDLKIQIEDK